MSCKSCTHKEHCVDAFTPTSQYCNGAKHTNADCIRSMTDEELADFLWSIGSNPLNGWIYIKGKPIFHAGDGNRWLDWLKHEAT